MKKERKITLSEPPAGPEALWTPIRFSKADLQNVLKSAKIQSQITEAALAPLVPEIEYFLNNFICQWMLKEKSPPSQSAKWAKDIETAVQVLSARLGIKEAEVHIGIPPDTVAGLLQPYDHGSFELFNKLQKQTDLPTEINEALEIIGQSLFLLKALAAETTRLYDKAKLDRKNRHEKDETLIFLFKSINDLYEKLTGKLPRVSNGSESKDGTYKGSAVDFSQAFLKLVAAKIKTGENNSASLQGSPDTLQKSETSLAALLARFSRAKISGLIRQVKHTINRA